MAARGTGCAIPAETPRRITPSEPAPRRRGRQGNLVRTAGSEHWTLLLPSTFAGDLLTLPQIAEVLSRLDGKEYVVQSGTVEEAVAAGLHPVVARGMTYMNVAPVLARPELARSLGLSLMSFETWARQRRGLA
ncbi:hypothetical protein [Archangium sp. Cb G35]|uniref:hypothetical protein n=1 Tax=Archangium sp. Cb G35 TaxID=1920190 RepID=UPI001E641A99|nr:hypothetical protein [Archangium sp. Cb G35]